MSSNYPIYKFSSTPPATGMVRRDFKINRVTTGGKFMQEYMYPDGKIMRAPSLYLGKKRRYYTDPRGDETHTYEESLDQQEMQGKTFRELFAQYGAFKPGIPRRSVESNFLITINPNRKWGEDGDDSIAKTIFNRTLQKLTSNSEFLTILKVPAQTRQTSTRPDFSAHYKNDALNFADVIANTEIRGVIEIGETQRRMHAHIVVEMKHYSMIQIDKLLIRNRFTEIWNEVCSSGRSYELYKLRKGPYIDVQLLKQKNAMQIIMAYMRK